MGARDDRNTSVPARDGLRAGLIRGVTLLALAAPLAACGVDRTVTGSVISDAYEQRHPIELRQEAYKLDIFAGQGLDQRTRGQIAEFAGTYHKLGGGQIRLLFPAGSMADANNERALTEIRQALVQAGVRGSVTVGSYPIADPRLASPIQLSFIGLKAKVASRCGQWPSDLASGSTLQGWDNRSYWNHGCAYQNMIASQVADPRDLADKQAEAPKDTEMRTRAIGNVRKGTDPGTTWVTKNSSIGSVGN